MRSPDACMIRQIHDFLESNLDHYINTPRSTLVSRLATVLKGITNNEISGLEYRFCSSCSGDTTAT